MFWDRTVRWQHSSLTTDLRVQLFQALKLGQDKTQEHVASLELKVDGLSKQLQLQQRSHDHLLDNLSALQQLMMRSLSTTACAGPPAQGEFA